jgi:hypothetical protein
LASQGGSVVEAMKIGLMVRKFYIKSAAPTYHKGIIKCPWKYEQGPDIWLNPPNTNCTCTSSCFLIWAAGVERTGDVLGVHRPYFNKIYFEGLLLKEAEAQYKKMSNDVIEYLHKMNIPNDVIEKMFQYSSKNIYFLEYNTVKTMKKVPFFEEWIIANCGDRTEYFEKFWKLFNKKLNDIKLTEAEQFYFDYLSEKEEKYFKCRGDKIKAAQLKQNNF